MKLTKPAVLSSLKEEARELGKKLHQAQVPMRTAQALAKLEADLAQSLGTPGLSASVDPAAALSVEQVLGELQAASRRLENLPAAVYDRLAVAEQLVAQLGEKALQSPAGARLSEAQREVAHLVAAAKQMKQLSLPGELGVRLQALADRILLETRTEVDALRAELQGLLSPAGGTAPGDREGLEQLLRLLA